MRLAFTFLIFLTTLPLHAQDETLEEQAKKCA